MNLVDIVADLAVDSRRVFAHPDAAAMTERVAGVEPLPPDHVPTDAIVIHHAEAGREMEALHDLASFLDRGVGVLLMEGEVAALPVGPVLQVLGTAGMRALSLSSLTMQGAGSVIVVSRDPDLPLRSHVLGEAFSTKGPDGSLRRDNEFVLESIVSRARFSALEADLRAQVAARQEVEASLGARVHDLEAQVATHEQAAARARAEVQRLERALTLVEQRSPGYRAMRLASRVKEDPVSAGRDVVGRLTRRKRS